jgi:hypothetical protein
MTLHQPIRLDDATIQQHGTSRPRASKLYILDFGRKIIEGRISSKVFPKIKLPKKFILFFSKSKNKI